MYLRLEALVALAALELALPVDGAVLGELLLAAEGLAADGAGEPVREVDGVDVAPLGGVVGEGHVAVRALGHQRHPVVHSLDVLQ